MLDIKVLKAHELEFIFKHVKLEGWDVEELHIRCQYKAHPKDFFIAYKDNKAIGFILAIKHSDYFGFISTLLVLKEFRKNGYGTELLQYGIKHLAGCQIALNSVKNKESLYEKFGFKSYFDQINYKFIVGSIVKDVSHTLDDFDSKLSLNGRSKYEECIFTNKNIRYKAITANNIISSFGISSKYLDGYKVVINSKNIDEALSLFFELIKEFDNGDAIYIESTKMEAVTIRLVKYLNMIEYSSLTRMYNKVLI